MTYNEKITITITTTLLTELDEFLKESYYRNRSDFINEAIRTKLDENGRI